MPRAKIDGIGINYEIAGSGEAVLLLAPGGFEAPLTKWRTNGVWKDVQPIDMLARELQVVAYDRRGNGLSGGRVEPLTWDLYAREALALLDHLGMERAFFLGGCIGCTLAAAIAARAPERCRALLMHWPVGGFRWMRKGQIAFNTHLAFVREHGLAATVARAKEKQSFWADTAAGPWATVIATDPSFAEAFARQDPARYASIVEESRDHLFSTTMPTGASGDQLMRMDVPAFIMSGDDASHATSAAHALRELMPGAKLSPVMPPQQNRESVTQWLRESVAAVRGR